MTMGRLKLPTPSSRESARNAEVTHAAALIGRETELERLRTHWLRVRDGQRESVLVRGDPGVGKTSIVRHFSAQLASTEALVLVAPGRLGTEVPPLWPWIELTRQLQRACPDVLLDQQPLLAAFAPWLTRTVPGSSATRGLDKSTHFQLIDSLTQLLIHSAEYAPVCLMLEDLHDFDAQSLAVVQELSQAACSSSPLLMLGTCRTAAALYAGERLTSVLETFEHCVQLSGLRGNEVAELLATKLQRPVSAALARRVHRRTDGNPLYVRALISVLSATPHAVLDGLDVDAIRLPDSMRRAGSHQLQSVSASCRAALEAAAILGREFELSVLALMLGKTEPAALKVLLEEATQKGIICVEAQPIGHYRFSHALLHEWLRDELSPEARACAHRLAAQVLEADPSRLYTAAHHWLHAADSQSLALAARAAEQAGSAARERGADAESAESFKIAITALRQRLKATPLTAAQSDSLRHQLAHCLRDMSDVLWRLGQQQLAFAGLLEVADLACSLDDAELVVQAALVTLDNCNVLLSPEQQKLCDLANARLDRVSARWRVQLSAQLGIQRFSSGDREGSQRLIAQARAAHASAHDDPQAELALQYAELYCCDPNAPLEERSALLEHFAQTASAIGSPTAAVWAECSALQLAIEEAHPEAVVQHELELTRATRRVGVRMSWVHNSMRWMLAFMRGEFDEAKRLLDVLAPEGQHAGSSVAVLHMAERFSLARALDETPPSIEAYGELAAVLSGSPEFSAGMASWHAETGELAQARLQLARAQHARQPSIFASCQLAHAARELGDAECGAQLYAALQPFERRFCMFPGGLLCLGAVAHFVGLAACAAGQPQMAVSHFQTAVELNRSLGALPALALTHYELARTLHAIGSIAEAHEHARTALQLAAALGMRPLVARCETAAHSGGHAQPAAATGNRWLRNGALWQLSFAGQSVLLVHSKGLDYIAQLLARPATDVHVLELIGSPTQVTSAHAPMSDALSTRARLEGYEPQLDATSLAQYRRRAQALQQALEEARSHNDLGRCDQLQTERELLMREVTQGSRARSRPIERARKAVYNRIRDSIRQLEQSHPALSRHLQASVHTGVYCRYEPEHVCSWTL